MGNPYITRKDFDGDKRSYSNRGPLVDPRLQTPGYTLAGRPTNQAGAADVNIDKYYPRPSRYYYETYPHSYNQQPYRYSYPR